MYNIFEARFCIRHELKSDDIDIAIPSVRLSVRDTSPLYSPIILAFGQLIAITKFGRRSPLTGPQILEPVEWYCAILNRCVRGLSRKRCKIVTIADHSNQNSYVL